MLHQALLILFPDYKKGDWLIQDDGDGPYVKAWKRLEPEPTAAEIEAARPVAQAKYEKEKANTSILAKIATLDAKCIRPLAEGDTAYLAELNGQIKALRAQLK